MPSTRLRTPTPEKHRNEPQDSYEIRLAAHRRMEAFARRHDLAELRLTATAIRRFLRDSGAPIVAVDRALDSLGIEHAYNTPNALLDHARIFSRLGGSSPILLMGSPYFSPSDIPPIHAIRALGLGVEIHEDTELYGFGTLDILIWSRGCEPMKQVG